MISIKAINDFCQVLFYKCFNRALNEESKVTSNTMLILLAGIKIAATIGERIPCTAKDRPIMLYKMDRTKLAVTILLPDLA